MSQFRDYGRDREDDLPRPIVAERPFDGVAVGASLQAAAHLLYVAFVLLFVFLVFVSVGAGPGGPGPLFLVMGLAGLGLCVNWILSVVAAAMFAFADTGARARGVGAAMLAFSVLVVLKLPTLAQYGAMSSRFGGGPFGDFDEPLGRSMGGALALFFFLCELARLSLVGWYVAAASPPGRPGLARTGQVLGILTPLLAFLALLLSFLVSVMASSGRGFGPRGAGAELGLVILFGNLALFVGVLVFGAALLMRLGSAVRPGRHTSEY